MSVRRLSQMFEDGLDLSYLAKRPLPDAPDGRYEYQVQAKQTAPPAGPTAAEKATHSPATIFFDTIKSIKLQPVPFKEQIEVVEAGLQALMKPDAIDDRKQLFVKVLAALCEIPQNLAISKEANDKVITLLYNSLPHPPATYIGSDPPGSVPWTLAGAAAPAAPASTPAAPTASWGVPNGKPAGAPTGASSAAAPGTAPAPTGPPPAAAPRAPWAFRAADGRGNNTWLPALGQSGRPYARDVESTTPRPAHRQPDAGLVFDALLRARDGDFAPHPNGNAALTFAFASLVTHSLFRTAPTDPTVNNTTSYLDLSPLYGTNQAEQNLVRNKEPGRGLLWNDAFAEDRLILVPPAASALLVIFSRNHNYIANILLKINERKRWHDPPPSDPVKRAQQDEEIFQVARNVNCGHFMAMIFGDYVGGFLGLPRDGKGWSMNPFDPIKTEDGEFLGRGEGNHVSVEFNLLYRWHAVTAQKDIQWTKDLFAEVFPGRDPATLQPSDFGAALGRSWSTLVDPNPRTRTFGGMTRGPDGSFDDDALANILQTATETMAGAYRARGHPAVFRSVEVMSIEQGRAWGVCSMNEFRQFLGLKPFASFEEWNSSVPGVAEAARQLYGHIDNLELYPGIQAEDCMPRGPGSGICCGYTMTRAILGDAVALVRGDRFYTTDYTPANLTAWGFQDCARDPDNGAYGAALPRLLMRHLPRHYPGNSVYALFPFFTPAVSKENLTNLHVRTQYTGWDGVRPKPMPVPKVVDTVEGIRHVFTHPERFGTTYGRDLKMLTEGYGCMVMFDDNAKHKKDRDWATHALFPNGKASVEAYAVMYKSLTADLIKENSYTINGVPGTRVDIVRSVISLVTVHWVADCIIGIPLKTKKTPDGLFTEQEVADMLALLTTCGFLNVVPEHSWVLEHTALEVVKPLQQIIEHNLKALTPAKNPIATILGFVSDIVRPSKVEKPYQQFLARLQQAGRPARDAVGEVLGLALGGSAVYAQAVAQIVDFYMDDARAAARADITRIANLETETAADRELLLGYVREAQRLAPAVPALLRTAKAADTVPLGDGKQPVQIQPGDTVFASFKNAHLNPIDFPDPETVNPRRPADKYELQGCGFHACVGTAFSEATIPEVLKQIFRLKNLRRAEGPAGRLAGFSLPTYGTESPVYLDDAGNMSYWPGAMTLVYDQ